MHTLDILDILVLTERKTCSPSSASSTSSTYSFQPSQYTGYIYLLHVREFHQSQQPVYKLGKTRQTNLKRFFQYPNGSILALLRQCLDCDQDEHRLFEIFKEHFNNSSQT